ncbi:putative beta-glucan-specific phosphotransferase system enzyme IIA component [Tetragenococcus halophilus subsp. halophilus]|uniref:Beta-glucan-specific phosphotransferase system enzyme IIA component n=2 Tax=Tetragenococcus halophilus TaxID=51669 RepID=A0AAN1SIB8_TETHN|nr:PTS lactose/cellobiose transporter subunit IIA [Tetragenococcus halophilus]AOF49061.1 PTS mannose transporter subunit IIA [Tetragenococcus halophilus]MCO7025657.1 PTS lactose/cellobiose transporter subunit IIA [Tetragenococcus halophilus]MCO8284691.1 PTS lactose/cellobiose transporter subunit IIA [Tetragenococcus halophilus]MCO8286202.1 PTS lactose/cellobiose transporter subunit IIA [Tetragenococcus halophilus]MCO8293635.1 PTS lactose/cellobiose transporter subunit IIA [Tetragenococcus halo
MDEQENMEAVMGLIMYGGNAKSDAMEAIAAAKKGDFELADQKLKDADTSLSQAHESQTGMLTKEAQGEHMDVTLLAVHSQDHLMTAIAFKDLATEIIDLYRRLDEK